MGFVKGALLALGIVVGCPAFAGTGVVSNSSTGVVLECSSGKVSMRDRVNVTLIRSAGGKKLAIRSKKLAPIEVAPISGPQKTVDVVKLNARY